MALSSTFFQQPMFPTEHGQHFSPKSSDLKIGCCITCAQIRHTQQRPGTWFKHAQRTHDIKSLRITPGPPSSMPAKRLALTIPSKQHWPLPCQCPHFLGSTCVLHMVFKTQNCKKTGEHPILICKNVKENSIPSIC